ISKFRSGRPGPESRRGREGDGFGARAKAYAATRGRGNADSQGRGSKIRGDQERFFDVRDAEDGGTPRHPQRKRAAVAKNSDPGAVSTTAGHPGSGHQEGGRGKARCALIDKRIQQEQTERTEIRSNKTSVSSSSKPHASFV